MSDIAAFTPLTGEAFPKTCGNCGRVFVDEHAFLVDTERPAHAASDVRSVRDDQAETEVWLEVFRQCRCGSTLMECFHSRRDLTEAGLTRRQLFDSMLAILAEAGVPYASARRQLLGQFSLFQSRAEDSPGCA